MDTIIESNQWGHKIKGPHEKHIEIECGGLSEIYGEITEDNAYFEFSNRETSRSEAWVSLGFIYDPWTGRKIKHGKDE